MKEIALAGALTLALIPAGCAQFDTAFNDVTLALIPAGCAQFDTAFNDVTADLTSPQTVAAAAIRCGSGR